MNLKIRHILPDTPHFHISVYFNAAGLIFFVRISSFNSARKSSSKLCKNSPPCSQLTVPSVARLTVLTDTALSPSVMLLDTVAELRVSLIDLNTDSVIIEIFV